MTIRAQPPSVGPRDRAPPRTAPARRRRFLEASPHRAHHGRHDELGDRPDGDNAGATTLSQDDFPEQVKRTLAARVAQRCSNPDCRSGTSGPQTDTTKAVILGVAAHITAAAPGGPRYDDRLSPDQRAAIEN